MTSWRFGTRAGRCPRSGCGLRASGPRLINWKIESLRATSWQPSARRGLSALPLDPKTPQLRCPFQTPRLHPTENGAASDSAAFGLVVTLNFYSGLTAPESVHPRSRIEFFSWTHFSRPANRRLAAASLRHPGENVPIREGRVPRSGDAEQRLERFIRRAVPSSVPSAVVLRANMRLPRGSCPHDGKKNDRAEQSPHEREDPETLE